MIALKFKVVTENNTWTCWKVELYDRYDLHIPECKSSTKS